MTQIIPLNLGRASNRSRYGHEGGSGLVNCIAEDVGEGGKSQYVIYARDGYAGWGSGVTGDGVRAMLALDTDLYVVAGRSISRVDTSGNATLIGGIIGDGPVTMARNRATTTQVGICADGLFKIATKDGIVDVTDSDLPPANSVCNIDGYFVLTIPDGRVYSSALEDGTSFDGLDFAKAEANPDGLVRGFVRNRDLCLFGTKSTEFYQNVGNETFPFSRTTSIDVGCLAAASVASVDQTVAWVAHDGTVRMLNGYQAGVISTYEVERLIDDEPDKDSIQGFSWQRRGHTFYAISGTNWTKVFDLGTQRWTDFTSFGLSRWRLSAYAMFDGKHIFGDYANGNLYQMRATDYSDAGSPIDMIVEMPPVHAYPYRMTHHEFYADVIPGVGLNSPDSNADPMVMLDYSTDGGNTYGSVEHLPIGKLGATHKRVVARRLGQCGEDGRVYRLRMSADVVRGIMQAAIAAERDAA